MAGVALCALDKHCTETTQRHDYAWKKGKMQAEEIKEDAERMRDFLWNQEMGPYAVIGTTDHFLSQTHKAFLNPHAKQLPPHTVKPPHLIKPLDHVSKRPQTDSALRAMKEDRNLSITDAFRSKTRAKDTERDKTYKIAFFRPEKTKFFRSVKLRNHDIKDFPVAEVKGFSKDPEKCRTFTTEAEIQPYKMSTQYAEMCTGHETGRPASPILYREARVIKTPHKPKESNLTPEEREALANKQFERTTHLRTFVNPKSMPIMAAQDRKGAKAILDTNAKRMTPYGLTVLTSERKPTNYGESYLRSNTIVAKTIAERAKVDLPVTATKHSAALGTMTGFPRGHEMHTQHDGATPYEAFFHTKVADEYNEEQAKHVVDGVFDRHAKVTNTAPKIPEPVVKKSNRVSEADGVKSCSQYMREFTDIKEDMRQTCRGVPGVTRYNLSRRIPFANYSDGHVVGVNSQNARTFKNFNGSDLQTFRPMRCPNPSASACVGPAIP